MFPVHIDSRISLNATKEYASAPLHSVAYNVELQAGTNGKIVGIPHDPDTFYVAVMNGKGYIVVVKRADFSVIKD